MFSLDIFNLQFKITINKSNRHSLPRKWILHEGNVRELWWVKRRESDITCEGWKCKFKVGPCPRRKILSNVLKRNSKPLAPNFDPETGSRPFSLSGQM